MHIMSQLRPPRSTKNKSLFDLPIAQRLTLGFLLTALIAGLLAGGTALIRIQSMHQQSDFYQQLLQTKTTLASGNDLLKLMDIQMHAILTPAGMPSSRETLQDNESQLRNLIDIYDSLLKTYVTYDLLKDHPEQISLLSEAHQDSLVTTQAALANSALRTWTYFRQVQIQILGDITYENDLTIIINMERLQGEPTFSNAQGAMGALISFNKRLVQSVRDAVSVEQANQVMITTLGIILAIISIALIGLLISNTIVYSLKQLRQLTKAVEQGEVKDPIPVIGNDEIAEISTSVNTMLGIIASEREITIASELKYQSIASISQELRNPLTKVFHWLEILVDSHQELDEETRMRFLGRAMYDCQELMQIVYSLLKEGTNFDDVVALLEKKVDANQIKQWLQDRVKLDGAATLLNQEIASPVVTQLIKNKADLRNVATNSQILLDGGIRVDLVNEWLKNGTHLHDAIAIMHLAIDLNLINTSSNVGDFTALTGATPNDVVSRIPKHAKILSWKLEPGTVDNGMKFGWIDTSGQDWEIRMHEQDLKAPVGSHAASGWVLRVRRGKEYMDASGLFYKQKTLYNHRSPYYDPKAANDTHIPIQAP